MSHPAPVHPLALLGGPTRNLGTLPTGEEVYHLPQWGKVGDVGRIKILRKLIMGYSRDPRIRTMAAGIISRAGVQARDYIGQANAILHWARATVTYLNEPGELLQSPWYSLGLNREGVKVRPATADCDDFVLLIGSLLGSIRLPTKLVLSGTRPDGVKVRYIESVGRPRRRVKWSHIYLMVGSPPFKPSTWTFMEPTLNVPIGWEVVNNGQSGVLPELAGAYGASALSTVRDVWDRTFDYKVAQQERQEARRHALMDRSGLTPIQQRLQAAYWKASDPVRDAGTAVRRRRSDAQRRVRRGFYSLFSGPDADLAVEGSQGDAEQHRMEAGEWVRSLPWAEIVAGTLPMVLSAVILDRYFKGRGR